MKPSALLAALRARLAARTDTEHQQAIIRLLNAAVLILYVQPAREHAAVWAVYIFASVALLADLFMRPYNFKVWAISPSLM